MRLFNRHPGADDPEPYERGIALYEQKRWSEAADAFAAVRDQVGGALWMGARVLRGSSLLRAHRFEEALKPLQDCLRLDPAWGAAHNALGLALAGLDRFDEANVHLAHGARLGDPQSIRILQTMDMDYCRSCRRPVHLTAPAEDDVQVGTPNLGRRCAACNEACCDACRQQAGDCPACGGDFDQGRAAYRQAFALFEQERWSEAAAALAAVADRVPDAVKPSAHLRRGIALLNTDRAAEAVEPLLESLRLDPDLDDGHNGLGRALAKLGRFDEAVIHTAHAARLGNAQALVTMNKLYMDYCRECHRPVFRTLPSEAEIRILKENTGMQCIACHTVFCIPCLRAARDSIILPPCVRCGGGCSPMERKTQGPQS